MAARRQSSGRLQPLHGGPASQPQAPMSVSPSAAEADTGRFEVERMGACFGGYRGRVAG
jgi:hypothetical protein